MKYLGIDYGRSKVGLAVGEGFLAEPYRVIKYTNLDSLINQIDEITKKEKITRIVVGISEYKMADESRDFGDRLNSAINLPVDFQDETLSSRDAQRLSIESGLKRKKRKDLEDAYAAAIMLRSYLDSQST